MQKHLDMLLKKYNVGTSALLDGDCHAIVDGARVPTLSWRYERRFEELKKLVDSKTVDGISVFRIISIAKKGTDLRALLMREMDVCRMILSTEITEVFAMKEGGAMNVSLKLASGVICTIELAATLPEGEAPISKHEIITARGIACDMNVDTQTMQSSVYVYGKENKRFTDVDFELYGLEIWEVATVRAAFAVAKDATLHARYAAEEAKLNALADAAEKSVQTLENIVVAL